MKKSLFVLLPLLLLVSCGEATNTSESDLTSSTPNSTEEETTSSVEDGSNSVWGPEIGKKIYSVLSTDIPYISNDDAEAIVATDDYGDPLLELFVYFSSDEELTASLDTYANSCANAGFEVKYEKAGAFVDSTQIQYDIYYCDKQIAPLQGIELQLVLGSHDGNEALGIFGMTYPISDSDSWPTEFITSMVGKDIPHLEGENLTYKIYEIHDDEIGNYAEVDIYNTTYEDEENYSTLLKNQNWSVQAPEEGEDTGYYAFDENQEIGLNYWFDTTNNYFAICAFKIPDSWKTSN